jgi:hypothetical protein
MPSIQISNADNANLMKFFFMYGNQVMAHMKISIISAPIAVKNGG